MLYDGTGSGNSGRLRFRYDGVEQTLSYGGTVGTVMNSATKYWFGADGAAYWNGDIAEVLMFTRAMAPSEVTAIENYFSTHWNI